MQNNCKQGLDFGRLPWLVSIHTGNRRKKSVEAAAASGYLTEPTTKQKGSRTDRSTHILPAASFVLRTAECLTRSEPEASQKPVKSKSEASQKRI